MNVSELMDDEVSYLPKIHRDEYFPRFMKDIFQRYLDKIDQLDDESLSTCVKNEKKKIEKFCGQISKAIEEYYKGDFSKAYEELEKGLHEIQDYLNYWWKELEPEKYHKLKLLYRIRVGNDRAFSKEEMFHIPFQDRIKVKMQRYSITGIPCIYLGSSAYICWDELGKPNFSQVQICRFAMSDKEKAKILDISYSPSFIARKLSDEADRSNSKWFKSLTSLFVIWPLMASCSIKAQNTDRAFKPEYIISQMLLQWVRFSKDYDGIKYFSVNQRNYKFRYVREYMGLYQNYVFPVKNPTSLGLCDELKRKFMMTDTVLWQEAKTQNMQLNYPSGQTEDRMIELVEGFPVLYRDTDFGYIERLLLNMPASPIA